MDQVCGKQGDGASGSWLGKVRGTRKEHLKQDDVVNLYLRMYEVVVLV